MTILITTLHGQFDVIPIFFILLTIYLLKEKKELGVSFKFFTLLFLQKPGQLCFLSFIARKIKNKKLLILVIAFPVIFSLIYVFLFKSSLISITENFSLLSRFMGYMGFI